MNQPILSMSMWTALSLEQRRRIRTIFAIPRSGVVEVHDGVVVTDGTTPKDFEALTVDKMQSYLGSDSVDFHKLLDLTIARVQDEIEGKPAPEVVVPVPVAVTPVPRKTRKKKDAE